MKPEHINRLTQVREPQARNRGIVVEVERRNQCVDIARKLLRREIGWCIRRSPPCKVNPHTLARGGSQPGVDADQRTTVRFVIAMRRSARVFKS